MQRVRPLLWLMLAGLMVASQALPADRPLNPPWSWEGDDTSNVQLERSESKLFCTQGVIQPPIVSFCCLDFPIEPDPGFDPAVVCVACSAPPFDDWQWWQSNVGLHVEACGNLRPCLEDPNIMEFCVDGALPVEQSTWGRIKATYRQ